MSAPAFAPVRAEPAIVALTCAALALRTISYGSITVTALAGAVGLAPVDAVPGERPAGPLRRFLVLAAGVAAFAAAREIGSGIGIRLTHLGVVTIVVAAIAEELFFRRFTYAWLSRWGPVAAVAGSAALFAAIHVPMYGSGVLAIDFAAGCLFGWQRWAGGGWTVPAATHVFANLLQMG